MNFCIGIDPIARSFDHEMNRSKTNNIEYTEFRSILKVVPYHRHI